MARATPRGWQSALDLLDNTGRFQSVLLLHETSLLNSLRKKKKNILFKVKKKKKKKKTTS